MKHECNPNITLEEITPTRAEDYLKRNPKNRALVQSKIKQYAEMMKQDKWLLNGETIQFDFDGNLLNGQHRLRACIMSQCSFKVYVVRGLPPEVMPTLDTGKSRTAGDALHILEANNTTTLSAAITWVLRYQSGNLAAGRGYFSHSQIVDFWEKNKVIEDSVLIGRKCVNILAPGIASGFHFLFSDINKEDGDQFMEDLASGALLEKGDPVYALRETLTKNKTQKIKFQPVEIAAKVVRAWNHRRVGNTVKSLQGTFHVNGRRVFPDIM